MSPPPLPSATRDAESRAHLLVVAVATIAFAVALHFRGQTSVWLTTGGAGAVSGALVLALGRAEIGARMHLGLVHWVVGLVGGAALTVATWLVYPVASDLLPVLEREVAALYAQLHDPPGPVASLPLVALVVVVEELVWRGLLFGMLARRVVPLTTVGLSTVLYAVPHIASGSWVLVVLALGCGAVWTVQRQLTGGLLAPILTHLSWSGLVFVAFPVAG